MMVAAKLRRLLGPVTPQVVEGCVGSDDKGVLLWVRLVPPAARGWGTIEGAVLLTADAVETITDDARGASPGARLEVTVPAASDEVDLTRVREQLAWLADRGIDVRVSGGQRPRERPHLALARSEDITLHVASPAVAYRLASPGQP